MPILQLYPFRFRDPLTGKWVRAHHKMQVPELQRHYSDWEITGAPQVRHATTASAQPFNDFATRSPAHAIVAHILLRSR